MLKLLLESGRIGNLHLANRLVRSATHEGLADPHGRPSEALFRLYARLARGGAGLIITGFAFVARDGISLLPGMLGIHDDSLIPDYRRLTAHVHAAGAAIAMQIAHAGRQTTPATIGQTPIAPSAVKDTSIFVKPREMTEDDIARVIEAFAQAARRVRAGGFDAVEFHAAHGYLLSSFLSPHTNRRRDRWGGSVANRMRIIRHIYRRSRELVGGDFPLLIKINAADAMPRGLRLEESRQMAGMLASLGFDAIAVSCGIGEDGGSAVRGDLPIDVVLDHWDIYRQKHFLFRWIMRHFGQRLKPAVPFSENYNLAAARAIKREVAIPVISVGGFVQPQAMASALAAGDVDFIALSRALIADPGFPRKLAQGEAAPSRCIHCNLCLYYLKIAPLHCYHGRRRATPRS
jgi:2,4-dienoyl-CoA reductase-like NADH-dependent reductase (Old Yellow Enzyme family)